MTTKAMRNETELHETQIHSCGAENMNPVPGTSILNYLLFLTSPGVLSDVLAYTAKSCRLHDNMLGINRSATVGYECRSVHLELIYSVVDPDSKFHGGCL